MLHFRTPNGSPVVIRPRGVIAIIPAEQSDHLSRLVLDGGMVVVVQESPEITAERIFPRPALGKSEMPPTLTLEQLASGCSPPSEWNDNGVGFKKS